MEARQASVDEVLVIDGKRVLVEGMPANVCARCGEVTFSRLILTTDLPEYGLRAGDLGTVVLVHKHSGYEVEFMTLDGETIAVVSLSPEQVRPVGRREIAHARLVTME
jgi:YgiT-type zinc finger domain-containing protein